MFCDARWESAPPGTAPAPPPTPDGRDEFCPQIFPTNRCLPGCRSPGEQILVRGTPGNPQAYLRVMTHLQHITGQPACVVCGNLARFSISAPRCIAMADECVSLLRERTKVLCNSSLQREGVCMTLHVCVFVSVGLEMLSPSAGRKILLPLCPHHCGHSALSFQCGGDLSSPVGLLVLFVTSFSSEPHLTS